MFSLAAEGHADGADDQDPPRPHRGVLALCVGVLAAARDGFSHWTAILAFLLAALIGTWSDEKFKEEAANTRRLELEKRRLELEMQQRMVDFGAEGARLYEQAAATVAQIAGSEAARAGWLGHPWDFDFRADPTAIADNLRRAEEIRKASGDGASIMHLTAPTRRCLMTPSGRSPHWRTPPESGSD